jgi:hypothetical protein
MVERYGYTWNYLSVVSGGNDPDGNPIAGAETWTPFECDVQTGSEKFVAGDNGDRIPVSYSIFTKVNTGLVRGGKVKDENGVTYTVLQVHNYKLNYEIWV